MNDAHTKEKHTDFNHSAVEDDTSSRRGVPALLPPDGGYGWVVVFASFCIATVIANCGMYGVFYIELLEYFQESNSVTAWPASLNIGLGLGAGPITSILCNRFGHRITCAVGSLLSAAGYIVCAKATSIFHWYAGYGVLCGVGYNLQFVTLTVMVGSYFSQRRAMATGLAVSGIGVGMFISAPLVDVCIKAYTWRGAALIFGGISLQACVFAALLRPLPGITDRQNADVTCLPDAGLLKEWRLILFAVVECLWNIGAAVYMALLPDFAYSEGMAKSDSGMLMSYMGIGSLLGRLFLTLLSNCRGCSTINVYTMATLISGICIFGTLGGARYWMFVLCSVMYGICFGLQAGLAPVITADLFGLERLTSAYGYLLLGDGLGCTFGPPFAGLMFDLTLSYTAPWLVCASLTCLASFLMLPVGCKRLPVTKTPFELNQNELQLVKPTAVKVEESETKQVFVVDEVKVKASVTHG